VHDTDNSGGDVKGDAQARARDHQDRDDEQIQMVSIAFLQLVVGSVDNNGSDLLVHHDENREENGRKKRKQGNPPMTDVHWINEPIAIKSGLKRALFKYTFLNQVTNMETGWHMQMWHIQTNDDRQRSHNDDGYKNAKVGDSLANLQRSNANFFQQTIRTVLGKKVDERNSLIPNAIVNVPKKRIMENMRTSGLKLH
jgi:hypothetical protein